MVPYVRKECGFFFVAKHSWNESKRVSEVKAMGDALSEGGSRADRVLRRVMRWLVSSHTKRQTPRNVGKDDQD